MNDVSDSPTATVDGNEVDFRSESIDKSGDYGLSRWNACTWQLRRENYLVCMGERCRYRFCQRDDDQLPEVGTPCGWEIIVADKLASEFDGLFSTDGLGSYLEDRLALKREWVAAHLLSNRAAIRMSRAYEELEAAIINRNGMPVDQKAIRHYALAARYMTAAHNRIVAIYDRIPALLDEHSEDRRLARVRRMMLENGYWTPYRGDKPPSIEDAPPWIIKKVDGEQ